MNLVFDIGGTYTRCAAVENETIVRESKERTPSSFEEGVHLAVRLAQEVLADAKPKHIVIGIAGTLAPDRRASYQIPQLPEWNGKSMLVALEHEFGCEASMYNDAELGALGEARYGAGREKSIVAYLTVGTAVGGARVVEGKLDANVWGFEPGHQIIAYREQHGRLLDTVGGMAMERRKESFDAVHNDASFWKNQGEILGIGITNAVLFWSPNIVVLDGSLGRRMPLEVMYEVVQKHTIFSGVPEIVHAKLGDHAGIWGGIAVL